MQTVIASISRSLFSSILMRFIRQILPIYLCGASEMLKYKTMYSNNYRIIYTHTHSGALTPREMPTAASPTPKCIRSDNFLLKKADATTSVIINSFASHLFWHLLPCMVQQFLYGYSPCSEQKLSNYFRGRGWKTERKRRGGWGEELIQC